VYFPVPYGMQMLLSMVSCPVIDVVKPCVVSCPVTYGIQMLLSMVSCHCWIAYVTELYTIHGFTISITGQDTMHGFTTIY
jgi:hypothetical protein